MSWMVRGLQHARVEFVMIAREADVNVSETCRRFGISRKTGYKWLDRYETSGLDGLVERSRRPKSSPLQLSGDVVVDLVSCMRIIRTGARRSCARDSEEMAHVQTTASPVWRR